MKVLLTGGAGYIGSHTCIELLNAGHDVVKTFEAASGCPVPYHVSARRPGDVAICLADSAKAARLLGWKAECDLADMCKDHWLWQKQNLRGYV